MASGTFQIKRVYDAPATSDGARVLVDRLWPRGISKDAAKLTLWHKDVAPSSALRQWFHKGEQRWDEFCDRYHAELDANTEALAPLYDLQKQGRVTLLYAARDQDRNHAHVLAEYLRNHGNTATKSKRVKRAARKPLLPSAAGGRKK